MPVDCSNSHWPGYTPALASRSELNAIHWPSGDQLGLKSPARLLVKFLYFFVVKSNSQMFAFPDARVETKARVVESGDSVP